MCPVLRLAGLHVHRALKERKKEILSTGLSASAMGPRAVAGGECTKGNHQESHLEAVGSVLWLIL
jgi:hypothetical protein